MGAIDGAVGLAEVNLTAVGALDGTAVGLAEVNLTAVGALDGTAVRFVCGIFEGL